MPRDNPFRQRQICRSQPETGGVERDRAAQFWGATCPKIKISICPKYIFYYV